MCIASLGTLTFLSFFFLPTLHHEFVIDWSEIFTEASFGTPTKVSLGQHDPSGIRSESAIGSADLDQMLKIFQKFFSQMDTECDVDHKQTLSNIMRFPNPPNRRSGRPIRTDLLTIFIFFFA